MTEYIVSNSGKDSALPNLVGRYNELVTSMKNGDRKNLEELNEQLYRLTALLIIGKLY